MNTNKPKRNSAPELLRILAMLGVIILHYNNREIGGALKLAPAGSGKLYYLFFTENLFICAVNVFVLISAYYLSATPKRKASRVAELILQVIFFQAAIYLINAALDNSFSWKDFLWGLLPANYFVILYCTLYLLGPYLNRFLDQLSQAEYKRFLGLIFVLFSVYTMACDVLDKLHGSVLYGLSTIGRSGSQHGYSIVQFMLLYLIGGYIRKFGLRLTRGKALLGFAICVAVMYVTSIAEYAAGYKSMTTWHYNNPFMIVAAICLVHIFVNMQFYSAVINELAGAAFFCFLTHKAFFPLLHIEKACAASGVILILHQLGSAVALYLISYFIYLPYKTGGRFFCLRGSRRQKNRPPVY